MKKLFLVLLVVALASFLFVGCLPTTPPSEGEGEGEGEAEVTVEIEGAVVVDGKNYVSCGPHTVTVTFPAPVVGGVSAYITCCTGDYGKASVENNFVECGTEVVLFPDADKKVWTGSGFFGCFEINKGKPFQCGPCCASYVEIYAGECEPEACIWFPVIVDCGNPLTEIEITADACECAGCTISFESTMTDPECAESEECCGDDCSGLASWSIVLYDNYPFDECCDPSICEEPIGSCSGTECPIECTTECLTAGTYYAVVTLMDNVGIDTVYYAEIVLTGDGATGDCAIVVTGGIPTTPLTDCVYWHIFTSDVIGTPCIFI